MSSLVNTKLEAQRNRPMLRRGRMTGKAIAPYLFVFPWFAIYFGFTMFSIIYSFFISLTEWRGGAAEKIFVGLNNYVRLVQDPLVHQTFLNTILFMLCIIPIQLILAMFLALALTNRRMIMKDTFRLFNFLPYLMSPVAMGLFFAILFEWDNGVFNQFLKALGLIKYDIYWLGEAWPARWMVSMITIWKYTGYDAIQLMAGINTVNPEIGEAAEIDGASYFKKLWYIVLPQLKSVMIFVVLTTMIGCFQIYEEPVMIFTGTLRKIVGGPDNSVYSVVWHIMETAFQYQRFGDAASISFLMFIFIAAYSLITYRVMNRGGDE